MRDKRIAYPLLALVLLVVISVMIFLLINTARKNQYELVVFDFVELGISYDEIIDTLGEPDRDTAFGVYAPEYDLIDGNTVRFNFSGAMRLSGARIITPQGERVDLFDYRDHLREMNTFLWILQIILCIKFISVAYSHGLQPNNSKMQQSISKIGEGGILLHRVISIVIFISAIILILPGLFGMNNWIIVYTALLLAILIIISIIIHIRSREKPLIIADIIIMMIALFVAYGRWVLLPL